MRLRQIIDQVAKAAKDRGLEATDDSILIASAIVFNKVGENATVKYDKEEQKPKKPSNPATVKQLDLLKKLKVDYGDKELTFDEAYILINQNIKKK